VRKGRYVHREEEHENHERWLVSYADMVTLLMAFFMMLYGMSVLDLKKFADFKDGVAGFVGDGPAIEGGKGILANGTGVLDAMAPVGREGEGGEAEAAPEVRGEVTRENVDDLLREVQDRVHQAGLDGEVQLNVDPRGVVIYLPDNVLFDSGSALINVEGEPILNQMGEVLGHVDNVFLVEGHTDDVPTRGRRWPTNWELSAGRATSVLRYLVELRGVPSARAGAAGYADTRPRVPNDSQEHRAMNRRVEIVIIIPPEEARDGQEIDV
jgi:chemotaxis protein MotB